MAADSDRFRARFVMDGSGVGGSGCGPTIRAGGAAGDGAAANVVAPRLWARTTAYAPRMSGRADEPEIEDLIERLRARSGELIEAMAARIETEIEFYRDGGLVPAEALRASCGANFEFMLESLTGDGSDPVSARETG